MQFLKYHIGSRDAEKHQKAILNGEWVWPINLQVAEHESVHAKWRIMRIWWIMNQSLTHVDNWCHAMPQTLESFMVNMSKVHQLNLVAAPHFWAKSPSKEAPSFRTGGRPRPAIRRWRKPIKTWSFFLPIRTSIMNGDIANYNSVATSWSSVAWDMFLFGISTVSYLFLFS